MSGQSRSHEDDLDIFKGMDGFEDLADDDSILVALLDDLQENTLLTLMGDNLLQDDLQLDESNFSVAPSDENFLPISGDGNLRVDVSSRNNCKSGASQCKRQRTEPQCEDTKRLRLDKSATDGLVLNYDSKDAALMHIMHDHSYASTSSFYSHSNSDEETSNEEGNSSDTGMYFAPVVAY